MDQNGSNYQVVHCDQMLNYLRPGEWVFFQRGKEVGGGYWLGRIYPDFYLFGLEQPVSLLEGLEYIVIADKVEAVSHLFDDDFELFK